VLEVKLPPRRRCHLPGARRGPARRARTLAVRWLVEFAAHRREKSMAQRLANELLDAQSQQGGAYKRKEDIFRMAQANKAFAHYRW
jgi:small subunit ribosomal protein S7